MNPVIDEAVTLKIKNLPQMNERDCAQHKYNEALKTMLIDPSKENINTFEEANKILYDVQDAYRIGRRLLIEFYVIRARISQELHFL